MQKVIEKLKTSKWWNSDYNNFDARSQEAKDFLLELGYRINCEYNTDVSSIVKVPFNEEDLIILVDIELEDPDYGSYADDWAAKEAEPTYRPVLRSLISTDDYNRILSDLLTKKKNEAIEYAKEQLPITEAMLQRYITGEICEKSAFLRNRSISNLESKIKKYKKTLGIIE